MDHRIKDQAVCRILSAQTAFLFDGQKYVYKAPTIELKNESYCVYESALAEGSYDTYATNEDLLDYLIGMGLWSKQKETQLEALPKTLEDLKVELFQSTFDGRKRMAIRNAIEKKRNEYHELLTEKHQHEHMTAHGYATIAQNNYLAARSIHLRGKPLYDDETYQFCPQSLLDSLNNRLRDVQLIEAEYREIARTDPWRGYYLALDHLRPTITDELRILLGWSRLYDNIREAHDCPHDTVVEDDDMLDGWLILKRREQDKNKSQKQGEEAISQNPKIRNAGEVFVVAKTPEDIARVAALNDGEASMRKQAKIQTVQERGTVKEQEMPTTRLEILNAQATKKT